MINRLFRTGFTSNSPAFIVFLAMNVLIGLIVSQDSIDRRVTVVPYGQISVWLLLTGLVAAGLSLLHHNKERRSRLYAQLPVTPLQVRLAYWCHVLLYLGISTLLLVLIMLLAGDLPVLDVGLFALLNLSHGVVVMAVLSIITGNSLRLIPDEIRQRTIIYFFMATFVTFLYLLVIGYVVGWYIYVLGGGAVHWGQLTLLMMVLCAGLTSWDVHLFTKRENYLG